ncbi:MAG: LD-carboxypeptidase [Candidatus Dadabacteria bacterium]|nr:MAG: LD-carboxypeptidase [Candidatus Dadabacteria bacterium]
MNPRIKPNRLSKGDRIGVVFPTSPCDPSLLNHGVERLRSLGFEPVLIGESYGCSEPRHLFSGASPSERASDLMKAFKDPSIKAIFCARGAFGSMEILPLLDFRVIRENKKALVGFSDITPLLLAISEKSGLVTVHGPMISGGFANSSCPESSRSVEELISLLCGTTKNPFEGVKLERISPATASEGVLMGGSLTMISSIMGTPWEPEFAGKILFLEDVGEKPYRIYRMLLQLELAGKLDIVSGVVLGSFTDCTHHSGPTVEDVFKHVFAGKEYPVLIGASFGHCPLNLAVPLGVTARLRDGMIEIMEYTVE